MAIRKILEFPDPRLRTKAAPVETVDRRIQTLVEDMFETMYDANGIGLAASQIDVHEQVIVIDLSNDRSTPRVFINPNVDAWLTGLPSWRSLMSHSMASRKAAYLFRVLVNRLSAQKPFVSLH